jgi:hypothetical protein
MIAYKLLTNRNFFNKKKKEAKKKNFIIIIIIFHYASNIRGWERKIGGSGTGFYKGCGFSTFTWSYLIFPPLRAGEGKFLVPG